MNEEVANLTDLREIRSMRAISGTNSLERSERMYASTLSQLHHFRSNSQQITLVPAPIESFILSIMSLYATPEQAEQWTAVWNRLPIPGMNLPFLGTGPLDPIWQKVWYMVCWAATERAMVERMEFEEALSSLLGLLQIGELPIIWASREPS